MSRRHGGAPRQPQAERRGPGRAGGAGRGRTPFVRYRVNDLVDNTMCDVEHYNAIDYRALGTDHMFKAAPFTQTGGSWCCSPRRFSRTRCSGRHAKQGEHREHRGAERVVLGLACREDVVPHRFGVACRFGDRARRAQVSGRNDLHLATPVPSFGTPVAIETFVVLSGPASLALARAAFNRARSL